MVLKHSSIEHNITFLASIMLKLSVSRIVLLFNALQPAMYSVKQKKREKRERNRLLLKSMASFMSGVKP